MSLRDSGSNNVGSGALAPERVLFLNPSPEILSWLSELQQEAGFDIDCVRSSHEACEKLSENDYRVIALRCSSSAQDDLSNIEKMRELRPSAVVVVLAVSEQFELPTDQELRASVGSILQKPWSRDDLREALSRSLRISRARTDGAEAKPRPAGEAAEHQVLLLEDDEADSELVSFLLQASVYQDKVVHHTRLQAALAEVKHRRFEVIVADLTLPDAGGIDAVVQICQAAPHTPLVVLTDYDDDATASEAMRAGAEDFLIKGHVDASSLQRSIRHAIERKQSARDISLSAQIDPLTGLYNRTQFRRELARALERAERQKQACGVLFIDLDDFKPVNDSRGYDFGDQLLVQIAQRLRQAFRGYDILGRLGGDEFAVTVQHVSGSAEINSVVERFLKSLAEPIALCGQTVSITASVGVAVYPDCGATVEQLLAAADRAMYAAKRRGRNTFQVSRIRRRTGMEYDEVVFGLASELKAATEAQSFSLYYQPQYEAQSGALAAAEGLLRWDRPRHGLVSPAEFIPHLEHTGDITKVGRWVIKSACKALKEWRALYPGLRRVSVNVSVRQLENDEIVSHVCEAIERAGIPASMLELEITETAVMRRPERARRILEALKKQGVRLAIDDFGTGHSALSYLYRFPFDTVKIDRSFVKDLLSSPHCRAVTRGILAMAKELELEIVAEGVETQEQQRFLTDHGCDLLQGYLFARPLPSDAFIKLEPAIAVCADVF